MPLDYCFFVLKFVAVGFSVGCIFGIILYYFIKKLFLTLDKFKNDITIK